MSSRVFADYRVVSLVNKDSCYCVEEKQSGQFYVWDAVDYELLSFKGRELLITEINKLIEVNHHNLIRCFNYVDHQATATLYLVKEFCNGSAESLIKKCKSTNSFIDEAFIWRIIYQAARAAHAMHTRGPMSIVLDLSAAGLHLDDDANVKLDFSLIFREADADRRSNRSECTGSSRDGSERRQRKGDTYALGALVQDLATLNVSHRQHNQKKSVPLPAQYTEQLRNMVDMMIQTNPEKRPSIEGILYHPSLVSQVVSSSLQQISLTQSSDSTQTSSETNSNCTKCRDNEGKLIAYRKKETALKSRENDIKEREKHLSQREKHLNLLEQLAKEKMSRAEVYLSQARRGRSADGAIIRCNPPDDLNSSSYSADTGDTGMQPTIAKVEPSKMLRPASLISSSSSRRSVRFETIPEFEEPLKAESEHLTWLRNKRNRFRGVKELRSLKRIDKENFEPKSVGSSSTSSSSVFSLAHSSTKENQRGILETFFR